MFSNSVNGNSYCRFLLAKYDLYITLKVWKDDPIFYFIVKVWKAFCLPYWTVGKEHHDYMNYFSRHNSWNLPFLLLEVMIKANEDIWGQIFTNFTGWWKMVVTHLYTIWKYNMKFSYISSVSLFYSYFHNLKVVFPSFPWDSKFHIYTPDQTLVKLL